MYYKYFLSEINIRNKVRYSLASTYNKLDCKDYLKTRLFNYLATKISLINQIKHKNVLK